MADPPDRTISAGPISCGNVETGMALSDLSAGEDGEDISRIPTSKTKTTLQPSVQLQTHWMPRKHSLAMPCCPPERRVRRVSSSYGWYSLPRYSWPIRLGLKRNSGAWNLRKETHCYWRSQMTQMLCACARSVLNIMLLVSATSHMPCRNIV